ncbi:uncharacterized protein [Watersipora subatra]|uniref:uncharacterized protein n=1 Tax=Watersipora subatra TaxID=2589382 RepID=UPI00355B55D3
MTSTSKLNTDLMSEEDCERILAVLKRDLLLRTRERSRLRPEDRIPVTSAKPPTAPMHSAHTYSKFSELEHSSDPPTLKTSLAKFTSPSNNNDYRISNGASKIKHDSQRTNTGHDKTSNTERICRLCGSESSNLFTTRNVQCVICMQWICKPCALWEAKHKGYICKEHVVEEGYSNFSRLTADWMYDSKTRSFRRTYKGKIAATIGHRLSQGFDIDSSSTIEEIPPLSLEAFLDSMKNLQMDKHEVGDMQANGSDVSSDKISVEDFFKPTERQGSNLIAKDELDSALAHSEVHANGSLYDNIDEHSFAEVRSAEAKKFLTEIDISVQKIRKWVASSQTEAETEEMLSLHRSTLSSLISSMEQALHLAVDNQSPASEQLVRHTDVSAIVCSIVQEYVGQSLTSEAMRQDGVLNYGDIADDIIVKMLEEHEEDEEYSHEHQHSKSLSPFSTISHSDYGSSKFPDFNYNSTIETDPDLLSLGQDTQTATEEDVMSEEGSRWDGESVSSEPSSNWVFRGKQLMSETLSSAGSLFNSDSASEESINIMAVPEPSEDFDRSDESFSDSDSDLTVTPICRDLLNASADSVSMADIMRKERSTSYEEKIETVSPKQRRKSSEYSETGEDSDALSFTTRPKSQKIKQGDVAKFTCTVSGTGPIYVYWFKEGEDDADSIETNEKYELSSDGNNHHLEVFYVSGEDEGQYTCVARGEATSSYWLFGLTVDESADTDQKAPLFLKELSDIEATEGEVVKFRCKVRAYPLPRVSWYKDGERLDSSQQYKIEKYGNRDYSLTITGVTPDHDAEFTVLAKNGAGESKSSAQLLVEAAQNFGSDRQQKNDRDSSRIHGENLGNAPQKSPKHTYQVTAHPPSTAPQTNSVNFPVKGNKKQTGTRNHAAQEISEFVRSSFESSAIPEESDSSQSDSYDIEDSFPAKPSESKTSLRAAMRTAGQGSRRSLEKAKRKPLAKKVDYRPGTNGEEPNMMKPVEPEEIPSIDQSHSSAIELIRVSPLNHSTPNYSATSAQVMENHTPPANSRLSEDATRSVIDNGPSHGAQKEATKIHQKSTNVVEVKGSSARPKNLTNLDRIDRIGVDVQPGFIRERQFLQYGDKITPAKSPAKHNKGFAPLPPPKLPETIQLHGTSQEGDLPGSRSEWSGFFPSVKQRKASFKELDDVTTSSPTENRSTEKTILSPQNVTRSSIKKSQAPAPPFGSSPESAKKKTVKKVIKRTVTRTTSTSPVSSVDSDEPPADGGDYVKVSGKWVRVTKTRQSDSPISQRDAPSEDVSLPISDLSAGMVSSRQSSRPLSILKRQLAGPATDV